ncbi:MULTISPECIES: DUF4157 domain-containing protein [Cyanophyceae]|uniref:eCIS core domain-containing protein n=1 Tax=Cyanophyceae TaxID=3028117 RepID=UPI00232B1D9A|nr:MULTISPECIES: DUF4157 domain-containing protein [Cyanophyceae]MDB9357340.1 DUF4157 domain-containing protein [Nodularia spumigena CS-587/03]MDB9341178.1 DUF4157 domain-containing protein [Nodularia spumigena CS-589/07]MDB9402368.1 DUF4157 domain-containing protein [Microcystis aeruginosa CS-567/02-A1]MDB9499364.1 DUF4157 domain-containing protein [Nodularia spumigena CS-336/02]MDB9532416.1 DUF4157 domain-containing protein [Nodularia spumigena CS-1038]
MKRQQVTRNNQQSKNETPLVSGILQRSAVHSQNEESSHYNESRFHQDFSQVPVTNTEPVMQAKSAVSEEEKSNKTGLPDKLKTGIENLSGMAMDDVRVHYNSSKPSQLQALAYTQGTEIHVASGQERHLPHEAWHVVQQMQGRVKPTIQAKGVQVNDDEGLEEEADVMGARAFKISNFNLEAAFVQNASTSLINKKVVQLLRHTKEEVETALKNGTIRSFLVGIYGLTYRHHNDEFIYMTTDARQEDNIIAKDAQYWYRAMPEEEYLSFASRFEFNGDSYGGIAPNRTYVRQPKYFGNNKPATHVVEFSTPTKGYLYNLFRQHLGVHGNPKAEGGGTFGLGPSGNGQGRAGVIFNQLLRDAEINFRVVDWKDKNPLP